MRRATLTDTLPRPTRRRARRKGERSVTLYGTQELLAMFECSDVPTLLAKLDAIGVYPHVSGPDTLSPQVFVSDYQLPDRG